MKHAMTLLLALASSWLIASTALAGDVCTYAVSSALGFNCPLHAGATVCTDVSPVTGACDTGVDCLVRSAQFFCRTTLVPKGGPRAQCPAGSRRLIGVHCFAPQPALPTPTATTPPTPTVTPGTLPLAFLEQRSFRAADGTAYQLVSLAAGSTADVRLTTMAGSSSGVGACQISPAAIPGLPASAVVGVLPPGSVLHPFNLIQRTGLFTPNDLATTMFTPDFGGRLTIGSGAGAVNVCASAFDCTGQPNVLPLAGLDSATGSVPAACIANGLSAGCDGANLRNAFAFGLASAGSPPVCTNPSAVTVNTTLCAPTPVDGFTLHPGEAIVFVHGDLLALGYSDGVAGFGVSSGPAGVCTSGGVIGATARIDSIP